MGYAAWTGIRAIKTGRGSEKRERERNGEREVKWLKLEQICELNWNN